MSESESRYVVVQGKRKTEDSMAYLLKDEMSASCVPPHRPLAVQPLA